MVMFGSEKIEGECKKNKNKEKIEGNKKIDKLLLFVISNLFYLF